MARFGYPLLAGAEAYKRRGIEARQRSTPPFVAAVQRDCIERFDATGDPEVVLDRLSRACGRLRAGEVDTDRLVERTRVSKPLDGYTQHTHTVAALERARDRGLAVHPGQRVEYVVVDDDKSSRERVELVHEGPDSYDAGYYETLLVGAAESALSPLGWDRSDIQRALDGTRNGDLRAYENE